MKTPLLLPNAGGVLVSGEVRVRTLDRPRRGKLLGRPLTPWERFPNGAATVGLNKILDVGFRNQTQITAWYIGLIAQSGFSALSAADTMGSHSGWTELTTYTNGTRYAWSPGAAASGSITISSAIAYTTSGDSDIRGIFVASDNTKGGSTGTLWATAVESAYRTILSGQQYQVLYTVTMTATS